MSDNLPANPENEMVDLHALFETLWRGRYLIMGVTLLFALAAFAISRWGLTPQYEASAYITVRAAVIEPGSAGDWRSVATRPDARTVLTLANTDSLLEQMQADEVFQLAFADEEEPVSLQKLNSITSTTLSGADSIRLQIRDSDPQRAAILANRWAEIMVEIVNQTYGVVGSYQVLAASVETAEHDYRQAQNAFQSALNSNRLPELEVRFNVAQTELACVLTRQAKLAQLENDLEELEQAWQVRPAGDQVALSERLTLLSLQTRALSDPCQIEANSLQIQVNAETFNDLNGAQLLAEAGQTRALIAGLQRQLAVSEETLSATVHTTRQAYENAQAEFVEMQTRRDTARHLYYNIAERLTFFEAVFNEGSKVTLISVPASVPNTAVSSGTTLNTLVTALIAGILSVFWVLWRAWYTNPASNT